MTHLNPDATDLISQNEPCRRKIYLDQAATSCPKAPGVADAVYRYLSGSAVNVNRGTYGDAYSLEEQILDTREQLLKLFHFTYGKGKKHIPLPPLRQSILTPASRKPYIEIPENKKLTSMLMHNKFIISDNKTLLTGSMNFSRTGFSGFNANNIVIISSTELASYYTKEFEQMYGGSFHTLKKPLDSANLFNIGGTKVNAYFSPQDKTVEKALVPLVNNAKNYIYLPVFVITHKSLTKALIDAKNRGVDVKIILDATSVRSNHTTHKVLRNAGIPLKTESFAGKVHTKSMIIDDKYVVTGSMNFSNSGENRNDENCLVIENPELAKFYKGWFEFIWKKIPDIYLKYSVRPESRYSIGSCYDGIDNDYDGKIDMADDGCR